jgi:two-component system, LytTR family, sensor histidine kinase AlgZ
MNRSGFSPNSTDSWAGKMKNKNIAYWLCQIVGWGSYTGFGIWITAQSRGWNVGLAVNWTIFFLTILLLTHLLRRQIRQRQWLNLPLRKSAPRLIAASILVGLCSSLQVIGLDAGTARALENLPAVLSITFGLLGMCIMWTLLYVAITSNRRAVEMRAGLREAQLRALEGQVNPHFLFNSLNTIRGMIVEDPAIAQDMVTRLANILRYNLDREKTSTAPLQREIEIAADYLAIESIRFDDRLTVRMEIQAAAAQAQVPSMLIQTLVENAVKHGIGTRTEGGEIVIRASVRSGALALEIVNSGQLSAPSERSTQIGLSNARERLQLLYGDQATLRLENRGNANVAAMVTIPA